MGVGLTVGDKEQRYQEQVKKENRELERLEREEKLFAQRAKIMLHQAKIAGSRASIKRAEFSGRPKREKIEPINFDFGFGQKRGKTKKKDRGLFD